MDPPPPAGAPAEESRQGRHRDYRDERNSELEADRAERRAKYEKRKEYDDFPLPRGGGGRDYDRYRDRDARRDAEERVSRDGLLCDDRERERKDRDHDRRGHRDYDRRSDRDRDRDRRDRDRDRDRDRNRERPRKSSWDDTGGATEQDMAAAQAQQLAMTQMWAAANPTMMQFNMQPSGRKQRELYVGNLPVGMVTPQQLKELFRAPLLTMPNIPDEATAGVLVPACDIASDGKFAFVEFRDEPICTLALTLFDKMEVCGRALNVGRPRGYVDPNGPPVPGLPAIPAGFDPLGLGTAPMPGLPPPPSAPPAPPPPPTLYLKLEGMLSDEMLDNDEEYVEIIDDIKGECESSGGSVVTIIMPRTGPLKRLCFVQFAALEGASAARQSMDQRQFDGNVVKAYFIEADEMPAA